MADVQQSALDTKNTFYMKVKKAIESKSQLDDLSPIAIADNCRRFYISGLEVNAEAKDVCELMKKYGKVAYVEMESEGNAFVTFKEPRGDIPSFENFSITKATPMKIQVFVGGLKPEINGEQLASFFAKFGPVHSAMIKYDPHSGISRCFGFVTFVDCSDVVEILYTQRFFTILGKRVELKKAVPMYEQRAVQAAKHELIRSAALQPRRRRLRRPMPPRFSSVLDYETMPMPMPYRRPIRDEYVYAPPRYYH